MAHRSLARNDGRASLALLEALEVSTSNTNNLGLNIHGVTDPLLGHPELWIVPALSRALIVNQDGDRVFDETLTLGPQGGPLALNHGQLFAIFDSQLWAGTQFERSRLQLSTAGVR